MNKTQKDYESILREQEIAEEQELAKELAEEQAKEKLEQEFVEQVKAFKEIASPLLIELSKKVRELEELSEKMGVPFDFDDQTYVPASLKDKFPDLDNDFVEEVTGTWQDEYGGAGWQHSAVC